MRICAVFISEELPQRSQQKMNRIFDKLILIRLKQNYINLLSLSFQSQAVQFDVACSNMRLDKPNPCNKDMQTQLLLFTSSSDIKQPLKYLKNKYFK